MATLLRMPEVAANATHAMLQAWTRNEGDPRVVRFCMLGLTCGTVVKLIGQSWLERMILRRMDSLRALARLRLTVS